jgi:hypothetical protein
MRTELFERLKIHVFLYWKSSVNKNRTFEDKIRGKIGFLEDEKETQEVGRETSKKVIGPHLMDHNLGCSGTKIIKLIFPPQVFFHHFSTQKRSINIY